MNVQLEMFESLHADFKIYADNEMDVLQFKSKIIEICSVLASYSFYCERKFIITQLKKTLNEISLISKKACKCAMVTTGYLLDVVGCLEMIIMLVKENEAIITTDGATSYSGILL
ncbi:hypothetical protein [Chitinophaga sp.]|uniref:hypothetical protein n=1 Tax=Chitinophaga sp. TaxID=1869181 RepID=UPI0031E2881A